MTLPLSSQSARPFPEAGLSERIGMPDVLDAEQQAAADELINGPRGAVFGPFRPLMQRPALLQAVAKTGETLRFAGLLDAGLREWTICAVARATSNIFEWDMHLPLAVKAGVSPAALAALDKGEAAPGDTPAEFTLAAAAVNEFLRDHRLSDDVFARARATWGDAALVELVTLIGYFAMVCGLMNVARTPGP